jgi:hypothetical protein
MYSSTHSLTSALDGGEWSASRPGRFTPSERAHGIDWIGGWLSPRAVLDAVVGDDDDDDDDESKIQFQEEEEKKRIENYSII